MKTPDQVRQRAAIFYSRNHRSWLAGNFKMLTINLDPPTGRSAERDNGAAVRAWVAQWDSSSITAEWEDKKLSYLGTYSLPRRVVLTEADTAARVAGKLDHWQRLQAVLGRFCMELGENVRPELIRHLSSWEDWGDATVELFIGVVRWVHEHEVSDFYIRELPIFGVDSKWFEAHRAVVEAVVGPLHFKPKPQLVEVRSLDPALDIGGMRYLACPVAKLGETPGERVLIVENHQSFLALPDLPATVAIFGGGLNAARIVQQIPTLGEKDVFYWGDLDSYGFYILELVRRYVPHARSILMDLDTVRDHVDLAVEEPQPSRFDPELLSYGERLALDYLRGRSAGGCLRIEQERILFDYAQQQLRHAVSSRGVGE